MQSNNGIDQAQSYPDVLNVGNTVFPMLYIYYYSDESRKSKIGSTAKFELGLRESLPILGIDIKQKELTDETIEQIGANIFRYGKMLTSAASKNKMWLWAMNNAVSALMQKYGVRLPKIKGMYYEGKNRSGTSYNPILDPEDPDNLNNMMEALRLMYENDLLPANYDLGTRSISLYTGVYTDIDGVNNQREQSDRRYSLPRVGQFTLNNKTIKPIMGRTFSGTDMKIMITLNDTVTMIKTMTSLSWSVHRGKATGRPLGRPGPRGRAAGSRTIAGTMIFAASDHEPFLDILSEDVPTRRLDQMGWNTAPCRKVILPDQLPPFDIMVIMNNEYGTAAITTIYGVEIVDYGAQLAVDNLINEHVYQYTASGMDPLVEAYADENGYFDPYGLLQGGYSEMWFRKEAAMEGYLHSDFEQQYIDKLKRFNTNPKTGKLRVPNDKPD